MCSLGVWVLVLGLVLGFAISCGLGHFIVGYFLRRLREYIGLPPKEEKGTPPWLTGLLERFFFTIAVAVNATGVLPAMIAWLGLKLVANWQLREDIPDPVTKANYKFTAIVAGLLSMLFAYVGGLVIQWAYFGGLLIQNWSSR